MCRCSWIVCFGSQRCLEFKKGCSWSVETLCPERGEETTKAPLKALLRHTVADYSQKEISKGIGCRDNSVPPCLPVSMLVSDKLSGYLLPLLLASVLFFAGSKGLSERQILLLLRADTQSARWWAATWSLCILLGTRIWMHDCTSSSVNAVMTASYLLTWVQAALVWNQPVTSPALSVRPDPPSAGA